MPREALYDCPGCSRTGFTPAGLKAHICRGADGTMRARLTPRQIDAVVEMETTMHAMRDPGAQRFPERMNRYRDHLRVLLKRFNRHRPKRPRGERKGQEA